MTGGKADERGSEGTRERGRESTSKRDMTAGETWNDTQEVETRHLDKATWKLNIAAEKENQNTTHKETTKHH